MYGAGADPIKVAVFRQARRHTQASIKGKRLHPGNGHLLAYMRRMLKSIPEHNWGLSVAAFLPELRTEAGNWSNTLFAHARATQPAYALFEREWAAQRAFNYPLPQAIAANPAPSTAAQAAAAASELLEWERFRRGLLKQLERVDAGQLPPAFSSVRVPPGVDGEVTGAEESGGAEGEGGEGEDKPEGTWGMAPRTDMTDILEDIKVGGSRGVFVCGNVEIAFNATDASVSRLVVLPSRARAGQGSGGSEQEEGGVGAVHNWAEQIGSVRYQTFTEADFEAFNAGYTPGCVPCDDFAKPGMRSAQPQSALWAPSLGAASLSATWSKASSAHQQCLFILDVTFAEEACTKYGAPRLLSLHYRV